MTVDWEVDHLQPIYEALGVSAVLVLSPTDTAGEYALTVIHKTEGITIEEGVNVYSNKPAVTVRMAQLTDYGLTEDDINDATLAYNGVTWTVKAHQPRTFPSGAGEMWLILER